MLPSVEFMKRKDGVKLAYTVFGYGPPLVFPAPWVTAWSLSFQDTSVMNFWMKLSQEFKIVLYDKHGCGQSDRNRNNFSLESEIADLAAIVDFLSLRDITLFGTSMAGATALSYAEPNQDKIRNLILYGTYANGKNLADEELQSAFVALVNASWGTRSKTLANFFIPDATPEQINQLTSFQKEATTPEIASGLLKLSYTIDVSALLHKIHIPTLVLHRKSDKAIPIQHGRDLALNIPDTQFKALTGNIHFPYYGDADEIITEIFEFSGGKNAPKGPTVQKNHPGVIKQLTIVFTDIISSTKLVNRIGDAEARYLFKQHDKIIRDQVKKHGGKELQNLGDGFMLSFPTASSAIKCGCDIHKAIAENLSILKLRVGINTGEVVMRRGEHPFGQAVVIASRIVSRCKGGEVLVSNLTKQMAAGSKFTFIEKESFQPKGFTETFSIYEVICSK